MHDGEGLLGIPWLGPLIFQIRKLRPCLESNSQRFGCSADPRGKGGLQACAGPSRRGCLAPGSWVPLGISDHPSPRRQCEASGRQASRSSCAGGGYMWELCERRWEKERGRRGRRLRTPGQAAPPAASQRRHLEFGPPSRGRLPFHPFCLSPTLEGRAWPEMEVGAGSCCLFSSASAEACLEQGQTLSLWKQGLLRKKWRPAHPTPSTPGLGWCPPSMLVNFQRGLGSQTPEFLSLLCHA